MLVPIPDILKNNKDAWYFSETEPWKPIAKDTASNEVKKAITDFVNTIQNKSQ